MAQDFRFELDRSSKVPLVVQLADAIRSAISAGVYKAGDILPTWDELASATGTSVRIPREALAQLAAEGYVHSRPRIGCQVLKRGDRIWNGRVLLVVPEDEQLSFCTVVELSEIRSRLLEAGYAAQSVIVARRGRSFDFSLLDIALSQTYDFIIAESCDRTILRRISRCGIPFASVGRLGWAALPNQVAAFRYSFDAAVTEFSESCRAHGIRSVEEFDYHKDGLFSCVDELRNRGIRVKRTVIPPAGRCGIFEGVERGAWRGFAERLRKGSLPDLFLFCDDYFARGALYAVAEAGFRPGTDVRVATFVNAGLEPAGAQDLPKIELMPKRTGATIAESVRGYLKSGGEVGEVTLQAFFNS